MSSILMEETARWLEGFARVAISKETKEGFRAQARSLRLQAAITDDTDLTSSPWIEITISQDGTRLWVNGPDGLLLRCYDIKQLFLDDHRTRKQEA